MNSRKFSTAKQNPNRVDRCSWHLHQPVKFELTTSQVRSSWLWIGLGVKKSVMSWLLFCSPVMFSHRFTQQYIIINISWSVLPEVVAIVGGVEARLFCCFGLWSTTRNIPRGYSAQHLSPGSLLLKESLDRLTYLDINAWPILPVLPQTPLLWMRCFSYDSIGLQDDDETQ